LAQVLRNDDTSKPSDDTEGKSHAALFQQLNENLTKLVVFLSGNGPVFIPQGKGKTVSTPPSPLKASSPSPTVVKPFQHVHLHYVFVLCYIADVCKAAMYVDFGEVFFGHSCVFTLHHICNVGQWPHVPSGFDAFEVALRAESYVSRQKMLREHEVWNPFRSQRVFPSAS
jgi:hypothetical protein